MVVVFITYVPCADSPVVPKYISSPLGPRYSSYYVKAGIDCLGPYSVDNPLGVYSAGAGIPAAMFAEMSVTDHDDAVTIRN